MLDEAEMSECLRCNIKEKNSKMKGMFAFTRLPHPHSPGVTLLKATLSTRWSKETENVPRLQQRRVVESHVKAS